MSDRNALLESALDNLPDGFAVFNESGGTVFWNQGAEAITGYGAAELQSSGLPAGLRSLLLQSEQSLQPSANRAILIRIRHALGQEIRVMARGLTLHNEAGEPAGTAVLFHPADRLDALPKGEAGGDECIVSSQTDFEERLRAEFEDFLRGGEPMGILCICVDQGADLRKTHGNAACQSMLQKVRSAIAAGLRPTEELCPWGDDEFRVLAHERTSEMLTRHAARLAGLARTADFRWWGDRLSLTVSIGAAQAQPAGSLERLVEGALTAMQTSMRAGGNRVTCATREADDAPPAGEEIPCTPS